MIKTLALERERPERATGASVWCESGRSDRVTLQSQPPRSQSSHTLECQPDRELDQLAPCPSSPWGLWAGSTRTLQSLWLAPSSPCGVSTRTRASLDTQPAGGQRGGPPAAASSAPEAPGAAVRARAARRRPERAFEAASAQCTQARPGQDWARAGSRRSMVRILSHAGCNGRAEGGGGAGLRPPTGQVPAARAAGPVM
jgi:hypothetical protein